MDEPLDCLIVGAGPAGLTAAIYAARFRLTVGVLDAGASRALAIPCTRNHAGFPDGVSGRELLARMRRQAVQCGALVQHSRVARLVRKGEAFEAIHDGGRTTARAVILATGVTNRRPPMGEDLQAAAVAAGRLRYCPVCDGYEVTDQTVAVIGTGEHGVREACFLRGYTRHVTLIAPVGAHALESHQQASLDASGIEVLDGPPVDFELHRAGLAMTLAGARRSFQAVYPALGSDIHSDLARGLGAKLSDEGCIRVDAHQRTSIPGLYAAGDVVIGLDQISHAMGEAGVAATTLRNDLADARPLRR